MNTILFALLGGLLGGGVGKLISDAVVWKIEESQGAIKFSSEDMQMFKTTVIKQGENMLNELRWEHRPESIIERQAKKPLSELVRPYTTEDALSELIRPYRSYNTDSSADDPWIIQAEDWEDVEQTYIHPALWTSEELAYYQESAEYVREDNTALGGTVANFLLGPNAHLHFGETFPTEPDMVAIASPKNKTVYVVTRKEPVEKVAKAVSPKRRSRVAAKVVKEDDDNESE